MAVNIPKKFGPDETDVDYELRLRNIELALRERQQANPSSSLVTASDEPILDAPGGLRLISNVATIAVEWNRVENAQTYEAQLADNQLFSGDAVQTLTTSDNRFSFATTYDAQGEPIEFFVRVTAIDVNGVRSPFSVTLSTRTGQAVTEHFVDEATTSQAIAFNASELLNRQGETTVIQRLSVAPTGNPAILIFSWVHQKDITVGGIRAGFPAGGDPLATYRFKRGDTILENVQQIPGGNSIVLGSANPSTTHVFFVVDDFNVLHTGPSVEYSFEMTSVTGQPAASADVRIRDRTIIFIEIKK